MAIPTRFPSLSESGQITIGIKPSPLSTDSKLNSTRNTPSPNSLDPDPRLAPLQARVRFLEEQRDLKLRERELEDEILRLEIQDSFLPILRVVAKHFRTTPSAIRGRSRYLNEADARQVTAHVLHRLHPGIRLQDIAALLSLTSHSTITLAIRAVADKRATDPIYRLRLEAVELELKLPPQQP